MNEPPERLIRRGCRNALDHHGQRASASHKLMFALLRCESVTLDLETVTDGFPNAIIRRIVRS